MTRTGLGTIVFQGPGPYHGIQKFPGPGLAPGSGLFQRTGLVWIPVPVPTGTGTGTVTGTWILRGLQSSTVSVHSRKVPDILISYINKSLLSYCAVTTLGPTRGPSLKNFPLLFLLDLILCDFMRQDVKVLCYVGQVRDASLPGREGG